MRNSGYALCASIVALACTILIGIPVCRAADPYPIIYTKREDLRKIGIALPSYGGGIKITEFPNKCFYYGPGGYDLSLSDAIVTHFKRRGFSLPSLCMGFLAPFHFDPESGKRLPTYALVDLQPARPYKKIWPRPATAELPLDLPPCLRNGRLFSDCKLAFDPFNGRKLANKVRDRLVKRGLEIEAYVKSKMSSGVYSRECTCSDHQAQFAKMWETAGKPLEQGVMADACRTDFYALCPTEDSIGDLKDGWRHFEMEVHDNWCGKDEGDSECIKFGITHIDASLEIDGGFGYALKLDGGAGGDPSREIIKLLGSGKGSSSDSDVASRAAPWSR